MKGSHGVEKRIDRSNHKNRKYQLLRITPCLRVICLSIFALLICGSQLFAEQLGGAGSTVLYHTGFSVSSDSHNSASGSISENYSLMAAGDMGKQTLQKPPVSRLKTIGASLLLPGLGHRLMGQDLRGNIFLVAEVAIITALITNKVRGNVRQDRYIDYAEQFAGIANADGRSDGYYQTVGTYISSDEYVNKLRTTARGLYGNDLEAREQYVDALRPTADEAWYWPSDAYRREFRDIRKTSRNAFRKADLMLGVALINRIFSAVDAARLVHKMNAKGTIYATMEDDIGYFGVHIPFD